MQEINVVLVESRLIIRCCKCCELSKTKLYYDDVNSNLLHLEIQIYYV
jgi:hypothetical protein